MIRRAAQPAAARRRGRRRRSAGAARVEQQRRRRRGRRRPTSPSTSTRSSSGVRRRARALTQSVDDPATGTVPGDDGRRVAARCWSSTGADAEFLAGAGESITDDDRQELLDTVDPRHPVFDLPDDVVQLLVDSRLAPRRGPASPPRTPPSSSAATRSHPPSLGADVRPPHPRRDEAEAEAVLDELDAAPTSPSSPPSARPNAAAPRRPVARITGADGGACLPLSRPGQQLDPAFVAAALRPVPAPRSGRSRRSSAGTSSGPPVRRGRRLGGRARTSRRPASCCSPASSTRPTSGRSPLRQVGRPVERPSSRCDAGAAAAGRPSSGSGRAVASTSRSRPAPRSNVSRTASCARRGTRAPTSSATPSRSTTSTRRPTVRRRLRGDRRGLVAGAVEHGEVLYAVPGSPLVLERTVRSLRADDRVGASCCRRCRSSTSPGRGSASTRSRRRCGSSTATSSPPRPPA